MRPRKPTKGRVTGVKFALDLDKEQEDLKKTKTRMLKELKEQERNAKEWFDKELDRNLNKL